MLMKFHNFLISNEIQFILFCEISFFFLIDEISSQNISNMIPIDPFDAIYFYY